MAKKKGKSGFCDSPQQQPKRRCFLCSGDGWMCNVCGESVSACECSGGPPDTRPCDDCDGSGIASADRDEK